MVRRRPAHACVVADKQQTHHHSAGDQTGCVAWLRLDWNMEVLEPAWVLKATRVHGDEGRA